MSFIEKLKYFYNPKAGLKDQKPFVIIRTIRFALSIAITAGIIFFLFLATVFVYNTFVTGETSHYKSYYTLFPLLTARAEAPVAQNKLLDNNAIPKWKSADSNEVVAYGKPVVKYNINIYPTTKSPFIYAWILVFVWLLMLLFSLWAGHRVLTNIIERKFFVEQNGYYLGAAGVLAILASLVEFIRDQILTHGLNAVSYSEGYLGWWFNWKLGIILLVVAEIFLASMKIKDEHDSMIWGR
jgi:hypothetical protein